MEPEPVYKALARCVKRLECTGRPDIVNDASDEIEKIMDTVPCLSECGLSNRYDRLEFRGRFRHMEEGRSKGYSVYLITVEPGFLGIKLRVRGQNKNGEREFIHDEFYEWLTQPVKDWDK